MKKTEKYVIKHVFIKPLFFVSDDFFQVVFLFFPHLIYLPQLIVDKKRISVIFKQKGKEIVNWHKNEGFPVVSKGKRWNYCISNLECILLTFLLFTVYHLFIQHNIFKDCIDRGVLNLGYGWESRYILVMGRASHIAVGEVEFRRLKGWRTLWSTFTRIQSEHLNQFEIQTDMTFCFVYVKISLFLQYRTIVFDYEMIPLVVKRTVK